MNDWLNGRGEQHLSNDSRLAFAQCWFWTRKLQARFLAGDYAAAVEASLNAQRLLWASPSHLESADAHFYGALSHAASCDSAFPSQYRQHVEALTAHYKRLVEWAENYPENFQNRVALIGAEIARIERRELDAERLYEEAIRSARESDSVYNEALANELAGRFYAARSFETISRAYLRNACYCYQRWGAEGRVKQLGQHYPHLRDKEVAVGTGIVAAPVEQLDLAIVIKALQAVSKEMVLEKLLDTVMRTAIEHGGAERAILALAGESEPRIKAEATTKADEVIVQLLDEPVTACKLPETLCCHVLRARESIILDDAAILNPFSTDPYFGQRHARSVLCLPLMNQATLIGVLYLEHMVPRVFVPVRIAVLTLLASQAAISLENARLYRNLETRETKIRCLVDANIIGIHVIDLGGQIIEANDAFLRMVGYEREDLASGRMRWADLTPPEWRPVDAQWFETIKEIGSLQPLEKEYVRKDGARVSVLVGVAGYEENGSQAVVFALDMSEQKRVERALRRSEADLHEAQRLSHTGSMKLDVASGRISVSPEIFRMFDAKPDDDVSNPEFWFGRVHPEDLPRVREHCLRCVAEKIEYEVDYRIVLPDATIRYQHSVGRPIVSASGTLVEYLATAMDVTEQVHARLTLESAFEEIKQLKDRLYEENVALREEIDEAARVNERTRIARELHDTLLQNFHGLMFQFQAARSLMTRRPDEAIRTLDDAIDETKLALAESRDAIQGLRSAPISKGNLAELLQSASRELAAAYGSEHPPVFDLIEEGERQALSSTVSSEIYRIGLELLRNGYRHANAQRIEGEIRYGDSMFRMRIRDDGKGIEPKVLKEGGRPGHWGLRGIRERTDRIGARLDLWSEPGSGTEARLFVPAEIAYESLPGSNRAELVRKA